MAQQTLYRTQLLLHIESLELSLKYSEEEIRHLECQLSHANAQKTNLLNTVDIAKAQLGQLDNPKSEEA